MEQTLSSIQNSLLDEISSSKNEPEWLKEYRKNSLNIYNELPAEVSPLYGKYTDAKRMDPTKVSLSTTSNYKLPDFLSKRVEEVKNQNGLIQVGTNIISVNLSDELKSIHEPRDFIEFIVQLTSELSSKPVILLSPIAKEDNIIHLWEIDLSPGIIISPLKPELLLEKRLEPDILFFWSWFIVN